MSRNKLGLTIALLGLLLYALRSLAHVSVGDILATLGRFGAPTLALALAAVGAQIVGQGGRMWSLFPREAGPRLPAMIRVFAYGQLLNAFVPARAGDVVKVVALARENPDRIHATDATGILLADKILDLAILLPLIPLLGLEWRSQVPAAATGPRAAASVALLAFALGLAVYLARNWLRRFAPALLRVGRGIASLRDPRRVALAIAFGAVSWLAELVVIRLLCHSLGYPLDLAQCLWVLLVLNAGIAVPISLANLGAFEAAMALGLSRFGVPLASGAAIGIAHHALQTCGLIAVTGGFALARRVRAAGGVSKGSAS